MRGVSRPAALSSLAHRIKTDENKLKGAIEELVKAGTLSGKVIKGQYVPTSFMNLQRNALVSQITDNGFIEDSFFDQLQINQDIDKYLKTELAPQI